MSGHVWLEDVLHPTRTKLVEDHVEGLHPDLGDQHVALRLAKPWIVRDRDVLKVSQRSFLDRLRGRSARVELMRVEFAGATFTWVARGWGGSSVTTFRRGAQVDVIAVDPR
jgi:hypothetical protein